METKPTARTFTIVVGVAFDETGEQAVRDALRIAAGRSDSELHLVNVITEGAGGTNNAEVLRRQSEALEATPKKVQAFLDERRDVLPGLDAARVTVHARLGAPAEAIHQLAVDLDANLIVVGTHGRRGLQRLALGSVAAKLAEIAHGPVLIARPRSFEGLARSPAAEPLCPDCAAARAASEGEALWCEFHARPHIRVHTYGSNDVFRVGGHDPGIVPQT